MRLLKNFDKSDFTDMAGLLMVKKMGKQNFKIKYEDKWSEYFDKGLDARRKGNFQKFIQLMNKAIREGEEAKHNPDKDPNYEPWMIDDMIAGPLEALGRHYLNRRNDGKARECFEKAIELRLKSNTIDLDSLVELVQYMSEAYDSLHMHQEDIEHCGRVLEYIEQRFGTESPEMVPVLNELAVANSSLAKLDKAECLYKKAIKITEKAFGKNSPEYEEALDELEEFEGEKDWAVCDCHPLVGILNKPL